MAVTARGGRFLAQRGRTITVYLADGDPNGVMTAEIMNRTGKVFGVP